MAIARTDYNHVYATHWVGQLVCYSIRLSFCFHPSSSICINCILLNQILPPYSDYICITTAVHLYAIDVVVYNGCLNKSFITKNLTKVHKKGVQEAIQTNYIFTS